MAFNPETVSVLYSSPFAWLQDTYIYIHRHGDRAIAVGPSCGCFPCYGRLRRKNSIRSMADHGQAWLARAVAALAYEGGGVRAPLCP